MSDFLVLAGLVLVVLAGSALPAAIEAALLSVNPLRVHDMVAKSVPGALKLQSLKNRLGRSLAVLVISSNVFQIFGSLMLGGVAAAVFSRHNLGKSALTGFNLGLTLVVILVGEIMPKALGTRMAPSLSLMSAPAIILLTRLCTPLILPLERVMPAITEESELTTDEEEIRLLARLGSQKGQIEADEAAMIAKVFQLNDLTARDLMLPRVSAPSLSGAARLDDLRDTLLSSDSPWWVVLGQEVDEVLGVASRDNLLTALVQGRGQATVASLSEPVDYVPEMIRADRLLTCFRRRNDSVRVVVDEFGAFVGLVGADAVLAVLAGWWRPRRP
ncbi:MAG: CNNM domain-containing protein [Synechococcus sp. Tobar2m-G35]|nr:CNNM domain-containing protein [Synechococcus sp. Tobar2m-G35]